MTFKPASLLLALVAMSAAPSFAQNIAVVNGKPIPSSQVEAIVKQMVAQGQPDSKEMRDAIKQQLISQAVLVQEAEKQGYAKNAAVKAQIAEARESIAISALVRDYITKHPVTDAEIQAEYNKFKAMVGDKEYHVRHILAENEADAKAAIAKIKGGAKFEDVAKASSKDQGSAQGGGDLDWLTPSALPKEFADAVVALQKGAVTENPVKTQAGYHVIKVEDVRATKVPSLEEIKPQIADSMTRQKLQAYQESLLKNAKIK